MRHFVVLFVFCATLITTINANCSVIETFNYDGTCYGFGSANPISKEKLDSLNQTFKVTCEPDPVNLFCLNNTVNTQLETSDGIEIKYLLHGANVGSVSLSLMTTEIDGDSNSSDTLKNIVMDNFWRIIRIYAKNIDNLDWIMSEAYIDILKTLNETAGTIKNLVALNAQYLLPFNFKRARDLASIMLEIPIRSINVTDVNDNRINITNYQERIADPLLKGIVNLRTLMKSNFGEEFETFKKWCQSTHPTSLAETLFNFISGNNSTLKAYITEIEYDKSSYYLSERVFSKHLIFLGLTFSQCHGYLDTSGNNRTFEKFIEMQKKIIDGFKSAGKILEEYWPDSVHAITRKEIDAGGTNQEIMRRIWKGLSLKYVTVFFVAVYDGITDQKNHFTDGDSNRVLYGGPYKDKNYVIFRSNTFDNLSIREEMKNKTYSDQAVSSSRNLGKKIKEEIGQNSSMVFVVDNSKHPSFAHSAFMVHLARNNASNQTYAIGFS